MLGCAPLPDTGDPPAAEPPAAASLNTSMAWVSMREGLVQFDNGTEGAKTIGVIVSREATPPAYAGAKDLPGFYTRTTKADGTARTVYLSMTDEMTTAKFNANVTVSIDGGATGFVSAITSAPEILHPNTQYYAHFYETTDTTGTAIEKLKFTTEDFPSSYPTTRGTYSSFYDRIRTISLEYKSSEIYLIPTRLHHLHSGRGLYAFTIGTSSYELPEPSAQNRPFGNPVPAAGLYYDLYNITPSGPGTNIVLWDGMLKAFLNSYFQIDLLFGGERTVIYSSAKLVLVTE
ncbi:hypothetical protein P0082_03620 [Candidatus Haliotispira prima]|uniref:Lipoprotein n=1 Tax=Candidatus Haliotispira prima TaxID=3034016 RepID=A0ABY8MIY0_9SPIO|nr:hypothetical protein P0082_03620 [Candidatus Haliotispira prima]